MSKNDTDAFGIFDVLDNMPTSIFDVFEIDPSLKNFSKNNWSTLKASIQYPFNVLRNKKNGDFVLEFALAGFSKDNIQIRIDGQKLIVEATKPNEESTLIDFEEEYRGISKRNMKSVWVLSEVANIEKISSSFEEGILKVVIPYKETVGRTVVIR